ncbi:MAG: WYL domain-containing protein [Myxococcales bacterium]|nr:WYL domain-containing protein [Myxococcales bacterium]
MAINGRTLTEEHVRWLAARLLQIAASFDLREKQTNKLRSEAIDSERELLAELVNRLDEGMGNLEVRHKGGPLRRGHFLAAQLVREVTDIFWDLKRKKLSTSDAQRQVEEAFARFGHKLSLPAWARESFRPEAWHTGGPRKVATELVGRLLGIGARILGLAASPKFAPQSLLDATERGPQAGRLGVLRYCLAALLGASDDFTTLVVKLWDREGQSKSRAQPPVPTRVRVFFSKDVARQATKPPWNASQKVRRARGGVVVSFDMENPEVLLPWLLTFGPRAKVLEPEALQKDIHELLSRTAALYAKRQRSRPPP